MQLSGTDEAVEGRRLAIAAEVLYLVNMLPAPGIGFLALLWLYRKHRGHASSVAACHLWQTIVVSLWAVVLIGLVAGLIPLIGGLREPVSWAVMLLYVLCVHSAFILFGVVALTKAMAGQPYRYPLIGPRSGDCGAS